MKAWRAFVAELSEKLRGISGGLARREAGEIVRHVCKIEPSQAILSPDTKITDIQARKCRALAARRARGEPLQYVLGAAYFWDKEYRLTPDVLIPRPDTETLVSVVLDHESAEPHTFLDLGVGSGIIADTLARHRPRWKAFGVDISQRALDVARENCMESVGLFAGDRLAAVKPSPVFDFLVSNPPYISSTEWNTLDPQVTEHEPRGALEADRDGLAFYEYLAARARTYLRTGGRIYCEIGYLQGEAVAGLLMRAGWADIALVKDLGGRDRVVRARFETRRCSCHESTAA